MSSNLLLTHGIDRTRATVSLIGDVDESMTSRVLLASAIFKDVPGVRFMLNTGGGLITQGFAVYDLLRSSFDNPEIVCLGEVASAGMIILAGGVKRVSYPGTNFLIHYGQDSAESAGELRNNINLFKRMKNIVSVHTTVKRRTVNSWFNKETYFDAQHAMKIGLITEVIDYE